MEPVRRRFPITFWASVLLGSFFAVFEVYAIIVTITTPCPGCVDEGAIVIYVPLLYGMLLIPTVIIGLLIDSVRNRSRLAARAEPVPPRPDVGEADDP
jgi:hypothetical protein